MVKYCLALITTLTITLIQIAYADTDSDRSLSKHENISCSALPLISQDENEEKYHNFYDDYLKTKFDMTGNNGVTEGTEGEHNGCNTPTIDIKFKFNGEEHCMSLIDKVCTNRETYVRAQDRDDAPSSTKGCSCTSRKIIQDGNKTWQFRIVRIHNHLCIQAKPLLWWLTLGCKDIAIQSNNEIKKIPLALNIVAPSCINRACTASHNPLPVSSMLSQCVKESVSLLIKGYYNCDSPSGRCYTEQPPVKLMLIMQTLLHNVIKILLTLYVILFAYNIIISARPVGKKELMILIVKLSAVMYFTGIIGGTEGIFIVYDLLSDLGVLLGNAFFETTNSHIGLCAFKASEYSKTYQYLTLWDALDCRFHYYLGAVNQEFLEGVGRGTAGALVQSISGLGGKMFQFIVAFTSLPSVIVGILATAFFWLFLSFVIQLLSTYISSFLIVSIMIIISPVMIPMICFTKTKQYYDSWQRTILGYSLYPIMLVICMTFMMIIFDNIMFAGCTFVPQTTSMEIQSPRCGISNKPITVFVRQNSDKHLEVASAIIPRFKHQKCAQSIGMLMNHGHINEVVNHYSHGESVAGTQALFEMVSGVFFDIPAWKGISGILDALLYMTIFMFIFYHLLGSIEDIAVVLLSVGSLSQSGGVVSGQATFDNFGTPAIKSAVGSQLGAMSSGIKGAKQALSSDKKSRDDPQTKIGANKESPKEPPKGSQ